MSRNLWSAGMFLCFLLLTPLHSGAQDVLADHRIRGLRGLHSVVLVSQPNDERQIVNMKELDDFTTVLLGRDIRELKIARTLEDTPNWLQTTYIITDRCGTIQLAVLRWVRLLGTNTEMMAKIWSDERALIGPVTLTQIKKAHEDLLMSFAADYIRANR